MILKQQLNVSVCEDTTSASDAGPSTSDGSVSKDDSFHGFRHLCVMLAGEPRYNAKTNIISDFIKKGTSQGE